jgi:starvation-inducible DNA-binding protein
LIKSNGGKNNSLIHYAQNKEVIMKMKSGMTEQGRKKIADELNHYLADSYSVYLKTQNFHWNVKGPHFYALHLLFEKQYEELADAADEIAERIAALGFYAHASFSAFKKCCIEQENKPIEAKKMIQQLVDDHEAVIRCARQIASKAEEEDDQGTVDMLAKRIRSHEEMAWMLRSHLQ